MRPEIAYATTDQKTRYHHLWALAGYALLTVVLTWPLLPNILTHVPGIGDLPADNYEYIWKMWWVPHALFEQGVSPFFHPDIGYPDGYPLAYGEITPSHTFLLAPLTLLTGPIVPYNLAIMLSFVLTGWFMYMLTRRKLWAMYQQSPQLMFLGAFLAGTMLAFSAYRFVRSTQHLPLIDTHWLVLAFLGLDLWLENRNWRSALLTGLGISMAALSSWYYGLMLALILPVYVVTYAGKSTFALLKSRQTWLATGLAMIVIAVLCLPFLVPYLQVSAAGAATIPLEDARFWSASPLDYLLPNALHPLWGAAIQSVQWPFHDTSVPYEFMVSLGWVTILLGLVGWRRTAGPNWRAFKWTLVVAFVLSLGPFLTIGRLPTPIPLPVLALRELLPFADGLRVWGRFSFFVTFCLALLSGIGFVGLVERFPAARQILLFCVAAGGFLFGMWRPVLLNVVEPRPVDQWLAQQPDYAPIMQFPVAEALSGPSMLYTRYHGKPIVYGYGTYFPFIFRERYPMLADFPADAAIDQLATWGVHYILVNTLDYDSAVLDAQPRLRHSTTLADQAVYELIPQSAAQQ